MMDIRRPFRLLTLGVLVTSVAIGALGPTARAGGHPNLNTIDSLMSRLMSEYHVPGAGLGLIQDGRVLLEKGYGYRNLDSRAPVTAETLFNIGSISKSFTALGIAQLVDQHKLDLDVPVIRYMPALRLSEPAATRTITLRQLLSHSGGLPPDEQWPPQVPPYRSDIIGEFATMPMTAQPGTRFQYCSRCVVLAALILQGVTGESWETYTRTHIFAPLGMTAASFGLAGLENGNDGAQPYRYDALPGQVQVPWQRLDYLDSLAPAAGIDANIADMIRYALFQLGVSSMSDRRVLSAQMLEELHRPEIAVAKSWWTSVPIQDAHCGLGWFTAEYRGARIVFHDGVNPGYRASIMLAPGSKAGVVVLTNGESMKFINAATLRLLDELLGLTPREPSNGESAKVRKQTH